MATLVPSEKAKKALHRFGPEKMPRFAAKVEAEALAKEMALAGAPAASAAPSAEPRNAAREAGDGSPPGADGHAPNRRGPKRV